MTNKCAHPACSCTVPEGKMYCSDKCATGNPSDLTRPPQAPSHPPAPSLPDRLRSRETRPFPMPSAAASTPAAKDARAF